MKIKRLLTLIWTIPGPSDHTPVTPTEPDISTLITPENVVLIKRMLIKVLIIKINISIQIINHY